MVQSCEALNPELLHNFRIKLHNNGNLLHKNYNKLHYYKQMG